ncbi:MAG: leucine-rich repeat protein, partial [Acholeplasmataceae bacterium]|nr:leucine-rich repeat protein [Acholeplasmataceae bacterium]
TVNGGAIGYGTFYYCSMLTDINLNGVTSIDAMAFYYCSNFTLRVYNTTPPTLNSGALSNASSFSIYVPSSSVYQYKTRDVWKNYTNVIFGM